MSNLDNLIFDRTQDDLVNDTDKAYISYIDLNRIEGACVELAALLNVTIETKVWVMDEFRTVSEMNRLRRNIVKLRNAYYSVPGSPATPAAINYLSITQANNIEKIMYDIYQMYEQVKTGNRRLSFRLNTKTIGNRRTE